MGVIQEVAGALSGSIHQIGEIAGLAYLAAIGALFVLGIVARLVNRRPRPTA